MSNRFFAELETPGWEPRPLPDLDDPEWEARFLNGNPELRKNLANGWLWVLNRKLSLDQSQHHALISEHRRWLRKILPYCSPALLEDERFDGNIDSILTDAADWPDALWKPFSEAVKTLWLGEGVERKNAIVTILKVVNPTKGAKRAKNIVLPILNNLIANLAWDVVEEDPEDVTTHIRAALLSMLSAKVESSVPEHTHPENIAWHCLSLMAQYNVHSFENLYGHNVLKIIHESKLVVAAASIPRLMAEIHKDNTVQRYPQKMGLAGQVHKPAEAVTDYDVLRAWIPSKKSYWDSAESLDIPYQDATLDIVRQELRKIDNARQGLQNTVNMPSDIAGNDV